MILFLLFACSNKNIYTEYSKIELNYKETGTYQVSELSYMGISVKRDSLEKVFKLTNLKIGDITLNDDKTGCIEFNGLKADIIWNPDDKTIELKPLNITSKYTYKDNRLIFDIKGVEVTYTK